MVEVEPVARVQPNGSVPLAMGPKVDRLWRRMLTLDGMYIYSRCYREGGGGPMREGEKREIHVPRRVCQLGRLNKGKHCP